MCVYCVCVCVRCDVQALVEDEDSIVVDDGLNAMRDREHGHIDKLLPDGLLNETIRLVVHGGCTAQHPPTSARDPRARAERRVGNSAPVASSMTNTLALRSRARPKHISWR
jgi:hypothetical protein